MLKENKNFASLSTMHIFVHSLVKWLKRRACDQHGLGSKLTRAILLCPREKHFTTISLPGGLGKQFLISVISTYHTSSAIILILQNHSLFFVLE